LKNKKVDVFWDAVYILIFIHHRHGNSYNTTDDKQTNKIRKERISHKQ